VAVGAIQVSHVSWSRPGGDVLLDDVSFRVGDGERAALVGANGVGKTTLVRLVAGDLDGHTGTITVAGRVGVMHQLVGSIRDATTVRELYIGLASEKLRVAGLALLTAERAIADHPDDPAVATAYGQAVADWGEAGGWDVEPFWDECTSHAVGVPWSELADRRVATFSGGEQKKLALEMLLHGDHQVLLLDEPDNFLDVPGKRWLERELQACGKTVLLISHDRELLAAVATRVITVEAHGTWTHGGSFAGYHQARVDRVAWLEKEFALHQRERQRLVDLVVELRQRARISETFAPKLKAAESRLRLFDEKHEPPERVVEQRIDMRLGGGRTGRRALTIERLELAGLTDPFDFEVWFGERVAVLGANGAGKSHFLRLLAGDDTVEHSGKVVLGARVVPGHFSQTHHHPDLIGRTLLEALERRDVVRGPAMSRLRRYELQHCAEQPFETLSGGQQARFQIVLLELAGATMLLLDEPTDNLDLVSAEALELGLAGFEGTVLAVTHDRWFQRGFDRFLVFGGDCSVTDHMEPPPGYR
jgi:ATPase subunit of ABC transporter with duplicated ATPase domains